MFGSNTFKKILNNKIVSKGVAQGLIAVGWPTRSVVELVAGIEGCPKSIYGMKVLQDKSVELWSRVASGELTLEGYVLETERLSEERIDDIGTWAVSVDNDLGDLARYLKLGEKADKAKWAFDRMKKEWDRPVPTFEEEAAATEAFNKLWDSISKEYTPTSTARSEKEEVKVNLKKEEESTCTIKVSLDPWNANRWMWELVQENRILERGYAETEDLAKKYGEQAMFLRSR